MRKSDCILVRVGELALKSDYVQKRFYNMLLDDVRVFLKSKKIDFRIETEHNRFVVFSKEPKRIAEVLRRVFGIVSFSQAWICEPTMDAMRGLGAGVAVNVAKIGPRDSFAVRAKRVGKHGFTSQEIGREVGDSVNLATKAGVDLSRPDMEIFVDCRENKAYVFVDKTRGPGGLPLGSGGRALAIVRGREDLLAAWLVMRRGISPILYVKQASLAKPLREWMPDQEFRLSKFSLKALLEGSKRHKTLSVIVGKTTNAEIKGLKGKGFLVLRPLVGLDRRMASDFRKIAKFNP